MNRPILVLLFQFLVVTHSGATPQEPDTLIIGSKQHKVYGSILRKKDIKTLDAIDKPSVSSNRRGYYIHMKIVKDELWITGVFVIYTDKEMNIVGRNVSKELFGKAGPIKASWFTGELHEFSGRRLGYSHVRENMELFVFNSGKLTKRRVTTWEDYQKKTGATPEKSSSIREEDSHKSRTSE